MNARLSLRTAGLACGLATLLAASPSAVWSQDANTTARTERAAARLAGALARLCPVAEPGDQAAFDACRRSLYRDVQVRRHLNDFVLWGRQKDPSLSLKDSTLTQFGPDVLMGMYVPLFMFNGRYTVGMPDAEGLVQIRLQTAFRNRLAPGQFPYPFWHDADKWGTYEKANQVILYWDTKAERVKVAQFTPFGSNPPIVALQSVSHPAFDGQWRWTDAQGRVQPVVTVFDGLMDPANPHLGELDSTYKRLALKLRDNQCLDCHVPNNPDRSKRLVLLQTPMHAAAEIKRLMESVRKDRMPRDDAGIEQPLDAHDKSALLEEGVAFERVLEQARQWEAGRMATAPMPALPHLQAARPTR
ncbi:hypothetical protein [Ideonella sp. A 288]|uniref:hypothetical protein n=1 Tax=Ideonella sp. A 288 TaxID=1962181 RepID=UPI000B4AD3D5|nr:hypothetical protein [Ideonella sp. A 288]